jgi:hypothetical protein
LDEVPVVEDVDDWVVWNNVVEVVTLLPQDESIRDDTMRKHIVNKYNLLFIFSSIFMIRCRHLCVGKIT